MIWPPVLGCNSDVRKPEIEEAQTRLDRRERPQFMNPSVGSQFKITRYRKMPKMMMGQIDHARARVRAIKAELLGKAPKREKQYDIADLVEGFRDGTVAFTGPQLQKFAMQWAESYAKERFRYDRPSFESIVLENAFAAERAADKKRFEAENLVYQNRLRKVNAEATKVEDAIVLGDQAAALLALQAFAAFKV